MRTIPLEVDTFKNESVAFGGIFVCQRIQRSKNFNYWVPFKIQLSHLRSLQTTIDSDHGP